MSWREWFAHAFAVESPGQLQVSDEQQQAIDTVCRGIVDRHLTTPALMALEAGRPLNFLTAQAAHFFTPFIATFVDKRQYEQFAQFLEQRGAVDHLVSRIEHFAQIRREGDQGPTPAELPPDELSDEPPAT